MAVRTTAGRRIVRFRRPSIVSFRTNTSVGLLFGRARLISVAGYEHAIFDSQAALHAVPTKDIYLK
jgi:hypothetical protein